MNRVHVTIRAEFVSDDLGGHIEYQGKSYHVTEDLARMERRRMFAQIVERLKETGCLPADYDAEAAGRRAAELEKVGDVQGSRGGAEARSGMPCGEA